MTVSAAPSISIILPAFNAEDHIRSAIESVRRQTLRSWELLVIDDGSTDETADIVELYQDPRIRLFRQSNLGVSAARNVGLKSMRSALFTFLDADDELPREALAILVREMERNRELDFLAGCVLQKDSKGRETIWQPCFHGDPLREFARLNSRVFFGVCLVLRRNDNIVYRFPTELSHCEDLLFFLEVAAQLKQARYGFVSETVYIRNLGQGSAMSNLDGLARGYRDLFRRVWEIRDHRIRRTDKIYLKIRYVRIMALSYIRENQYLKAAKVLLDLIGLRLSLSADTHS